MNAIILPLAIAQTIVWASIFYLFPALLPTWELETGWSKAELTGAFTLALLTTAVASPIAGRLIDHGKGKNMALCGITLAILCLITLSQINALWQFYAVWLMLGLCMAFCLYEPSFAILVRHLGSKAKPAITRITLIAGLAGTVAFPSANFLTSIMDWRSAVLCFAAGVTFVTLPLTYFALTRLEKNHPVATSPATQSTATATPGRPFWLLALSFMMISVVHGMIITHFLPLLAERGITTAFAILVASSIGPMQVAGRLMMVATENRTTTLGTGVAGYIGMILGISVLIFAGTSPTLILVFVLLHGAAYGVTSVIRPILTREILGEANFGLISGRIGGLFVLGTAIAPFGGALIWQVGGYDLMLAIAIVLMILGLILLKLTIRAQ